MSDLRSTEPEYLSGKQLAKKLNVSLKAVVKWTHAQQLPVIKFGKLNRYPLNEIVRRISSGKLLSKEEKV
jgi:excisionase family DNA binding protein